MDIITNWFLGIASLFVIVGLVKWIVEIIDSKKDEPSNKSSVGQL